MNVYVVATGERGEGQIANSVHGTLEGAKAEAFLRHDVTPYYLGGNKWRASINGCDEVWIYRLRLADAVEAK